MGTTDFTQITYQERYNLVEDIYKDKASEIYNVFALYRSRYVVLTPTWGEVLPQEKLAWVMMVRAMRLR